MERIGLQSIWQDAGFQAGIAKYDASVQQATSLTQQAATTMSSGMGGAADQLGGSLADIDSMFAQTHGDLNTLIATEAGYTAETEAAVAGTEAFGASLVSMSLVAASAIAGIVTAVWALGEAGTGLLRTREAFDSLAESSGADAAAIRGAMDDAAAGLIHDADLMQEANKLMGAGVKLSAEQMTTVLELARLKAHQYGITTAEAYNRIADAIARGTTRGLRSLGIFVNVSQAMQEYGDSAEGAGGKVDEAARAQATMTAVMEEGQRQLKEYGTVVDDERDKVERMHVAFGELKEVLEEGAAPAVADVAGAIGEAIPKITTTANQLVIMTDAAIAWAGAILMGKDATEAWRQSMAKSIGYNQRLDEELTDYYQRHAPAAEEATDLLAGSFANAVPAALTFAEALSALGDQEKKLGEKAGEDILKAEQDADDKREKARASLMESLSNLERDHAKTVAGILADLAQVDVDLQKDIAQAEADAIAKREKAYQDYADAMADLDRKLAQDQIDAEAKLNQDLADLDRELDQDREDARTKLTQDLADLDRDYADKQLDMAADLNRDLEQMALDHNAKLADMERSHLEALVAMHQEYSERLADITERYARERASIEEKYSLAPKVPSYDEQREALQAELKALIEAAKTKGGINESERLRILTALDKLKTEELAALDERKQAELDELNKWLGEEQAARDAAYQASLSAEETAYQTAKTARQARYDQDLADLQTQHERAEAERQQSYDREIAALQAQHERAEAERQLAYQREQADLIAQHERAEAERQRAYTTQLANLDTELAAEKARLETAAAEQRQRLQDQLADEAANYADRRAELAAHYAAQMKTISAELEKQKTEIETKMALELDAWVEHYKAIDKKTYEGLRHMLDSTLDPLLKEMVDKYRAKFTEVQDMLKALGLVGGSPAPWWEKMGRSWSEGLVRGFDVDSISGKVQASLGQLTIGAAPQGGATAISNTTHNHNLSVTANYAKYQGETSLRDDLALYQSMMRARAAA
jgi:hypothetical protein